MEKKEVSDLSTNPAKLLWARLKGVGADWRKREEIIQQIDAIAATCQEGDPHSLPALELLKNLLFEPLAYHNEIEGDTVNDLTRSFLERYGYGVGRVGFQGQLFPKGYKRDPKHLREFLLKGNLVTRSNAARYAQNMTYYDAIPWIEQAMIDCLDEVATGTVRDEVYRGYMESALLYLRGALHEGIPAGHTPGTEEEVAIKRRQRAREKAT